MLSVFNNHIEDKLRDFVQRAKAENAEVVSPMDISGPDKKILSDYVSAIFDDNWECRRIGLNYANPDEKGVIIAGYIAF